MTEWGDTQTEPLLCAQEPKECVQVEGYSVGGFSLPSHGGAREAKLHLLCPVRALACYVERTAALRRTEQLFVCFGGGVIGKALSKKRLAGIAHAYGQAGRACPTGICAHSTQAVAVSTALFNGVSGPDFSTVTTGLKENVGQQLLTRKAGQGQ